MSRRPTTRAGALLAHQVDAVLPSLQRSAAKTVQFMFVTWDPEYLRDAVGPQRATFGMPFVQATVDERGKLHATFGSQKTISSKQEYVDIFIAAGVPAAVEPDMCAAFESVCVAGMQRGGGASWAESMTIARGLNACFALLQHLDYQLYPSSKARQNNCPAFLVAAMLWSVSRITASVAASTRRNLQRVSAPGFAFDFLDDRSTQLAVCCRRTQRVHGRPPSHRAFAKMADLAGDLAHPELWPLLTRARDRKRWKGQGTQ